MSYSIAAISTGPLTHLDHLAPLCYLLEIPLIVTDEEHERLGKIFYPMVDIQYVSFSELTLEAISKRFDAIFTCGKFWAMELGPAIEMMFGKKILFIFSPHGNSDKEALLNRPISQDFELTYSQKTESAGRSIAMGNIRLWFYKEHKAHFDLLAAKFFSDERKNVLYAPTWQTTATTTSFFEHTGRVISSLKQSHNLIIKLHPLLEENDPAAFHGIIGRYEKEVQFILDFPPIFPLLEKTDIYLGDYSSVGYDFLCYGRPMYFLGEERGELRKCGELFSGSVNSEQKKLSLKKKELFQKTFSPCDPIKIKALLTQSLSEYYSSF